MEREVQLQVEVTDVERVLAVRLKRRRLIGATRDPACSTYYNYLVAT